MERWPVRISIEMSQRIVSLKRPIIKCWASELDTDEEVIIFQMEKETPKIQVVVRKRPLNRKELNSNDQDVVEVVPQGGLVVREMK